MSSILISATYQCGCRITAIISAFQAEDWSSILHTRSHSLLAQLAERCTVNAVCVGSNPTQGATLIYMYALSNWLARQTVNLVPYKDLGVRIPPHTLLPHLSSGLSRHAFYVESSVRIRDGVLYFNINTHEMR